MNNVSQDKRCPGQNSERRLGVAATPGCSFTLSKYYKGVSVKTDEMGKVCNTHAKDEKCI
jgi:hypothetical protein